MDYGPPANAIDLGKNKRAFQWMRRSTMMTPMVANTQYSGLGSPWITSNTTITGGQTFTSECIYTLTASWDVENERWMVDGYRQPQFMCE